MSLRYILTLALVSTVCLQFIVTCIDSVFEFIHIKLNGTRSEPEAIKKSMGHIAWSTIGGIYAFFALTVAVNLLEGTGIVVDVRFSILSRIVTPFIEISISLLPLWASVIPTSKSYAKQEDNLIAQFLAKKNSDSLITHVSLLFAFIGEYILYVQTVLYMRTQKTSILWALILTVILFFCNWMKQRILQYRVSHGLYGTCYSEAKEIVTFILEWHRENGNSNGKPPKLVFTQEELDECLQVNGGEEYAG
ncbi:MAG: hypothetical protein IJT31_09435 [Oscillibacter sp.]|nr:hypothetical protein [Oscillibacter sp.]